MDFYALPCEQFSEHRPWKFNLVDDVAALNRLAAREAVGAIRVGIAGLPDDQREAIRLHVLEGRSLAETAAAMNRSPGAVRALIHRGKQQLRDGLGRASVWLSGR